MMQLLEELPLYCKLIYKLVKQFLKAENKKLIKPSRLKDKVTKMQFDFQINILDLCKGTQPWIRTITHLHNKCSRLENVITFVIIFVYMADLRFTTSDTQLHVLILNIIAIEEIAIM